MLVRRLAHGRAHSDEREVARLRDAGWSEAKLRRWRDQRAEVASRKAEAKGHAQHDEVEHWLALLAELLDAKLDHVGLLVHWVTDSVRRGPTLPRARLNADTLANLDENVLYTFTRRP
jgi:hypothetical protein